MNEMTEGHTVRAYNGEMAHLHQLVLDLGNLALDQLRRAVKTLEDEDPEAARQVIDRDQEVNALDVEADEEIIRIIAKRQPMAKDLRDILTVSKTVADLERVGDEARKIAGLTIHFFDNSSSSPSYQILHDIISMSNYVEKMLIKALEAFEELDLEKALDVIRDDEELEIEFRSTLRRLSTFVMEDARNVGHFVDVVLGVRALERIGGHAKNIGGFVVFLVTAKDVRHEDLRVVEKEIRASR